MTETETQNASGVHSSYASDAKSFVTADDSLYNMTSDEDEDGSSLGSGAGFAESGGAVRFGSVRVRTHNITLGNHPSVSSGPPITLDWDPVKSDRYTLQEFEELHGADLKKAMRLSRRTRENWLKDYGHTQSSFDGIEDEIVAIKKSRAISRREASVREVQELTPMEEYKLLVNLSYRDYQKRRGSMGSQASETTDASPKMPVRRPSQDEDKKKEPKKQGFLSRIKLRISGAEK